MFFAARRRPFPYRTLASQIQLKTAGSPNFGFRCGWGNVNRYRTQRVSSSNGAVTGRSGGGCNDCHDDGDDAWCCDTGDDDDDDAVEVEVEV